MKLIIATILALTLVSTVSQAGTTCQRIGIFTYCNVDGGPQITCQRIGQFTYCN